MGLLKMNFDYYIMAFILSAVFTISLTMITRFLGEKGLMGNLYESVRGGTPRALGVVPYILLGSFLPPHFNNLVLIVGFFALLGSIIGREKIRILNIEWGQLLRGIGMLSVMVIGFPTLGFSSILIALLVQPINISDMQPGSTCSLVIIMTILSAIAILVFKFGLNIGMPIYFIPLITLSICLGYAPLDYAGKIMMGEVGNHSFAIALGLCFYVIGGFLSSFLVFLLTTAIIAIIKRNNLKIFFKTKLKIMNPLPGDYFMDILTGGGLGDMFRRIFLGKRQIYIKNPLLMFLGFRRLLFNPYATYYSGNLQNGPRIIKNLK